MLSGSFVISLAIAIVINKSPASGFTIARDILNSAPDLEVGESKQLEVRYDLQTLNDNKTIFNNKTREDSDSVIAINNTNNYSDEKVYAQRRIVTETTDTQTKISENDKIEKSSETTTINSTDTDGSAFTTTAPTLNASHELSIFSSETTTINSTDTDGSAFTTTAPTLNASHELSIFSTETSYTTDSEIEYSTVKNIIPEIEIQQNTTEIPEHQNYTGNINSTTTRDTTTASNNVNTYGVDINENKTTSGTTTVADSESKITITTFFSDQKAHQTNTNEASAIATTDGSLDAPTTVLAESTTDLLLKSASTEETTETLRDEIFTLNLFPPTLPPWKKYTTIDRKRTSTEDTTTPEKYMTRAETAQTRISLEKGFTNTPISSLENFKNDFINAQPSSTKQFERTTGIETSERNASGSETNTSTAKMRTEIETEATKLELVSRRAGYRDNRETTTAQPSEASATEFSSTVTTNRTETYSTMYETDVDEKSNKNDSVYGSRSQLVEDAIKEALLREEMLNDNEEYAKLNHLKQQKITDGVSEIVPEDTLSVKPIGQEKKKNTILYAVSPNYKPLKKIDIQSPKQFVRDPDDNSWRNESISSLGIVFKPKNASKSFTQVLKNKTETELGNMTDKDSKDDLPDLRVRLEKIAEVRKSKKKVNKLGDTVFSDYEESSESSHVSREELSATKEMSPDVKSVYTPPPPSQSQFSDINATTEFDIAINSISKEQLDLFRTENTSPVTTNKPKKVYNLAEYYDTTDEYDADYLNLHEIDLKKFTKPYQPKEVTTQLPEWLRTQPMKDIQPERKATLQYFPPTQKVGQKVNINKHDTNFDAKVNLYTINNAPLKDILDASFGTISPKPTEKYVPLHKATMKPVYTPMYQTKNLDKNLYLSNQPSVSEPPRGGLVLNDGNFNRASYVVKHYREFINEAAKGSGEDERSEEYPYTEPPVHGVTVNELTKLTPRDSTEGEDYEYDVKFRKDIMNRFVDNFNQNSERFKVDFPILYNSSVVHRQTPEHGRVASSSAFMKRLYEVSNPRPSNFLRRPCDHCDKTVELSPAYELHYYVPDEEEKEEVEPRATPPYRYRL